MNASDNNTVSILTQGGVSVTALAFFSDSIMRMIPWLIVAVPLILLDLNFGIKAAKYRKETIRFSKAFRGTIGKTAEYLCWIILAATMSLAFSKQWIEWVILGSVIVNELSSIVGNYFESKGMKIVWRNIINAIFKIGGQKVGVDTDGIDAASFTESLPKPAQPRNSKGQFVSTKR